MSDKRLPNGKWIFVPKLPVETTDETLRDFISQCGYDLPLENITVRQYVDHATGMICIDEKWVPDLLAYLFEWFCSGQKLNGVQVKFVKPNNGRQRQNQKTR